jgi:ribosomal protein L32
MMVTSCGDVKRSHVDQLGDLIGNETSCGDIKRSHHDCMQPETVVLPAGVRELVETSRCRFIDELFEPELDQFIG